MDTSSYNAISIEQLYLTIDIEEKELHQGLRKVKVKFRVEQIPVNQQTRKRKSSTSGAYNSKEAD